MKINDVLKKYGNTSPKILLKVKENMLILETDTRGLAFLGNLILAHAKENDCGFQISPRGPGNKYFSSKSSVGIYLHRIPCPHRGKQKREQT